MEVAGWFIGAGIGTGFTALYDGVKKLMGRTTQFKAQLEALKLTLEAFDPEVIQQIGKHNQALRLPNEDVEALEQELNKGVRIISELADAHLWNRIDSRYIKQLVQLNNSLNVLERRVKMQSVRDVKETRHIVELIFLKLTLQQESCTCRDIGCGSSLLSTRPLLDININAPHEAAIHHMLLNLDPVSNTASTSTVLQQIHANGERQEVGSSSRRLPSPLGYSNYEGSNDQSQINCEQLATNSCNGSYFLLQKIVIKLAINCDRSRTKALKIATCIAGVDTVAIDGAIGSMEVVGAGVDGVALVKLLRKRIGHAHILHVAEVVKEKLLEEEKPPDRIIFRPTSTFIKICKLFKRTLVKSWKILTCSWSICS